MLANVNLATDLTSSQVRANRGVGNRGTIEINPRAAMTKDSAIYGVALWNATPAQVASIHAALGAGLANRTLRPVVRQDLPLEGAPRAHVAVLEPGAHGKIILVP